MKSAINELRYIYKIFFVGDLLRFTIYETDIDHGERSCPLEAMGIGISKIIFNHI